MKKYEKLDVLQCMEILIGVDEFLTSKGFNYEEIIASLILVCVLRSHSKSISKEQFLSYVYMCCERLNFESFSKEGSDKDE